MKTFTMTCFLALFSIASHAQEVALESPAFAADCAEGATLTRSGQTLKVLLPAVIAQLDAGTISQALYHGGSVRRTCGAAGRCADRIRGGHGFP